MDWHILINYDFLRNVFENREFATVTEPGIVSPLCVGNILVYVFPYLTLPSAAEAPDGRPELEAQEGSGDAP